MEKKCTDKRLEQKISELSKALESYKQREKAIKESENYFRAIFEHSMDGVVILDPETARPVEFNDQVCRQLGYSREEFARLVLADIDLKESADEAMDHIRNVIVNGFDDFETLHRTKQNEIRHVHVSAQVIHVDGHPVYHCIWRDITERKNAEKALRESERKYRELIELSPVGIFKTNSNGRVLFVNPKMSQILGADSPQETIDKFQDLNKDLYVDPNRRNEFIQLMKEKGSVENFEYEARGFNGNHLWLSMNAKISEKLDDGSFIIDGFTTDITERKKAETDRENLQLQLLQSQKMESVGRLAGGVAHDFNNMLGIILGNAEIALDYADSAAQIQANLEEIRKAANRSADLVRQLLAFARKQTISPKVLDLSETVEGMLKMLRRLVGENIDLAWLPGSKVWPIRMDPSQIDQVLANLCVNSRDAIEDVGKITIETGNAAFDEADCKDRPGIVPGEYVLLAVMDDGCGMSQKTMDHLFEPFFTTKDIGKGTGLGLATVYGIVKQNNGFINVYSEPGQGTAIKIYMPRYEEKVKQIPEKDRATKAVGGKETILLVEDEPAILKMAAMMLEKLGYHVLGAHTPGDAIRMAREHAGEIHLLMTDVVMPEMNGRDLARTVRSLYPDLKNLFMSGYTANVIARHGILVEGMNFIQKPFSRQELASMVRKSLWVAEGKNRGARSGGEYES